MSTSTAVAIAILAFVALILVRAVRRIVKALIGFSLALFGIVVSIGGSAVLLNNVSISDSPGVRARVYRFLTVNWATTSDKGLGSTQCGKEDNLRLAASPPLESEGALTSRPERGVRGRRRPAAAATAVPSASPTTVATRGEAQEDYYPELVRRGYPGLSRVEMFRLSQDTVNSLGGWKIVNADPRTYMLRCVYTTRIFHFDDDVQITVLPSSEIDICSRSQVGAPDSNSLLGLFPGDFAANIGHIKEFYAALEPRVDAVYKEKERNANRRGR